MDEKINIQEIFENISKDNSLLSKIDINELLKHVEKSEYLENKTLDDILNEKIKILNTLKLSKIEKKEIIDKLTDYRYIQSIHDIHKGKHIRWIKKTKNPLKLENGAIVSDILFTDTGTNIQCITYKQTFFQLRMDDCIIFQKMNTEELLILTIQGNLDTPPL